MDRYLLFGGDQHYPLGGWEDFQGGFPSSEAAIREAANWGWDWWHVIDLDDGSVVTAKPVS